MSGLKGEIFTFTVVDREAVPEGFEWVAPYVVAEVDVVLESGEMRRMPMRVTDLEPWNGDPERRLAKQVSIGMEVEVVTRILSKDGDRGLVNYGYVARKPIERE